MKRGTSIPLGRGIRAAVIVTRSGKRGNKYFATDTELRILAAMILAGPEKPKIARPKTQDKK
jgi:hypothetical protein